MKRPNMPGSTLASDAHCKLAGGRVPMTSGGASPDGDDTIMAFDDNLFN